MCVLILGAFGVSAQFGAQQFGPPTLQSRSVSDISSCVLYIQWQDVMLPYEWRLGLVVMVLVTSCHLRSYSVIQARLVVSTEIGDHSRVCCLGMQTATQANTASYPQQNGNKYWPSSIVAVFCDTGYASQILQAQCMVS